MFGMLGALHLPVATTTASKSYNILQLFIGFEDVDPNLCHPLRSRCIIGSSQDLFHG